MSETVPKFGDKRTLEKLEILESYAKLYVKVLSGPKFNPTKHYIDAFAGAGHFMPRHSDKIEEGSALRIIKLDFDYFHFIEQNASHVKKLKSALRHVGIEEKLHMHQDDANDAIPEILDKLNKKDNRALIFLDPFGLSVKWKTLKYIAESKICDVIYLFPVHSVLRAIPKEGKTLHSDMMLKLTELFGMSAEEIETRFYKLSEQMDWIDDYPRERDANYQKVEEFFRERLNSIFPYVFDKPKQLALTGKPKLYSVFLFVSNKSEKAHTAITKLGYHALK